MSAFSSSSRKVISQVHVVKCACQPFPLHNVKLLCIYIQSCFLITRKLFRLYMHTQKELVVSITEEKTENKGTRKGI